MFCHGCCALFTCDVLSVTKLGVTLGDVNDSTTLKHCLDHFNDLINSNKTLSYCEL